MRQVTRAEDWIADYDDEAGSCMGKGQCSTLWLCQNSY